MTLPQKQCIKGARGSYIAHCIDNGLDITSFSSADCSGDSVKTTNDINVCSIIFRKSADEQFVMNDCSASPAPPGPNPPGPTPPPAPTSTPAPAPTPTPTSAGTFIQKQCTDAACTQGCTSHTFQQNTCLSLTNGGSATAVCQPTDLLLTIYLESSDCTGASMQQAQSINTCEQDESGTYLENVCPASSNFHSRKATLARLRKIVGKK